MGYAKRTDANQSEIVSAYLKLGFSVHDCSRAGSGFPDLVVGKNSMSWLVEVKTDKGKSTKDQVKFKKGWRGCYRIVRTVDDVVQHYAEAQRMAAAFGFR